jgi:hypothetical protein
MCRQLAAKMTAQRLMSESPYQSMAAVALAAEDGVQQSLVRE